MEPLEHFLISMAKEGLIEGELRFGNKIYTFSKQQGQAKVNVKDVASPPGVTPATEKRKPVVRSDRGDGPASKTPEASRAARPYKYLLFLLIFVAAILLAIFGIPYLSQSSGKANGESALWNQALDLKTIDGFQSYLEKYPQGHYSMDAVSRIHQIEGDQTRESDFQAILAQAETFFSQGDFKQSLECIEKARKTRNSQELDDLESKISEQISAQSKNEQSQIYMQLARQAFERNELQTALEHVSRAKEIETSDQVLQLEENINKQIDINKKDEEFSGLIEKAKKAIEQNQLDQASDYLKLAAEIKTGEEVDLLKTRIESKRADAKKESDKLRRDAEYKQYYDSARNHFDKGNYDSALATIKKAKAVKATREVASLEKEIVRVQKGLETEKQRIAREEVRAKTELDYRQAMTQAKTHMERGQYNQALKKVEEARNLLDTREAKNLETQINDLKNRVPQVRTVKLIELPPQMINTYNEAIKKIEVLKLARAIKALGQISLSLKVRADGKIAIQQVNDSALKVFPLLARRNIKTKILRKISSIFLPPPIDKKGMGVMVSNWRVTFSVGTFMNKIILRRKF